MSAPEHRRGSERGRPAWLGLLALVLLGTPVWPLATPSAASITFVDLAPAAGLDFSYFNGMTGQMRLNEVTGAGVGLLDYDGDGDLDAYLVQGGVLEPDLGPGDAVPPFVGPGPPLDRLFRNDSYLDGDGLWVASFVDVTDQAGIRAAGYGMGIAVGDYDRDGWLDLYVTNFGRDELWRNRGDGTFQETSAAAGLGVTTWSTAATFADYDRDGWPDLYVVGYVHLDPARRVECFAPSSRRDFCGPSAYEAAADRLFRNRGDGAFDDLSSPTKIGRTAGPGLGVLAHDFDHDGRLDYFVANDGKPNYLWLQQEDGTFMDDALFVGVAVNRDGEPEASMGIALGDADGDGDQDLFVSHLDGETSTLYLEAAPGLFEDRTVESGLASPSLDRTGFGAAWLDLDQDGWFDLWVVNGAVKVIEAKVEADSGPLAQANQVFRNLGGGRFQSEAPGGGTTTDLAVSRGLAVGDVDGDGRDDLLEGNTGSPARLWLSRGGGGGWLGVGVRGVDGVGTRVVVERSNGRQAVQILKTSDSYASVRDPRARFGLGGVAPEAVRIDWPQGARERWRKPPPGRYLVAWRDSESIETRK